MASSTQLTEALVALGPGLVLLMTFAETAFITGLVVPAGPTIMAACVLALEGYFGLGAVVLATVAGGALGDSCGFWVGRRGGRRILHGGGRLASAARRQEPRASALIQRHSAFAVTVGRLISFVRTLMPLMAGMSRLPYPRFLAYDVLGVAGWAAAYIALGVGAGVGWQRVRDSFGPVWAAVVVAVALVAWILVRGYRFRGGREGGAGPSEEPVPGGSWPP